MKNYNSPFDRIEKQIARIDASITRNKQQTTNVPMHSHTRSLLAKQQAVKASEDVNRLFARLGIKS